jgi:hypothetical protein
MYSFPDDLKIVSSDKFYFACSSYGFISPVLSLIDEIISKSPEINIIVMDEAMRLFWHQLITNKSLNWNLIFLNTKPPGRFRDILSWLKIRPNIRRLYNDNFKSVENAHFIICGTAYNHALFSLVKLIAKKNTVIFLNIIYGDTRRAYSLKALILLIHAWVFYRIDISARCTDSYKSPVLYLSERFFKKLNIQLHEFKYHYDAALLHKYNPIPALYTSGKKIMWLDDDSCAFERKMPSHILICLKAMKSIIDKNFTKSEVLYKRHPNPGFQSRYFTPIYSDYDELPSFMNADFIISNPNIKFILGGFSAVLSTAAKNTNIIAVSYIKLIPVEDQSSKKRMIEYYMKESDNKIIFLDSLEELNFLIEKQKNQQDVRSSRNRKV